MINQIIAEGVADAVKILYQADVSPQEVQIQKTRKEFEGDLTVVVFPFSRMGRKSPEAIGEQIGKFLQENLQEVGFFNVIKGFLNVSLKNNYWIDFLIEKLAEEKFGISEVQEGKPVVIEFSSPNTNKPLHLGHVRNILLGDSIASILEASGRKVARVNLVNDRGIHICKSMLAWQKWGEGTTPETADKKGDKFVGDYYVQFEKQKKLQVKQKMLEGYSEEEADRESQLMQDAREVLKKWEQGDPETRSLWSNMNEWVYLGFDETYKRIGAGFDKIYYESDTYLLGRELVKEGLERGILYEKEDGSIWCDLSDKKLSDKLLLRSDGTSVYMTQDLGTAQLRFDDYHPDKLLYVVGNEQNHHFDVLKAILQKLGKEYAKDIIHISYGMVELPHGKMKSREGTVVDADDLIDEMRETAAETTRALGKIEDFSEEEANRLFETIGLGALKYFILKVDPKKHMLFNPEESIQFDGNTGPFIQYTHARIRSLLRKAAERGFKAPYLENVHDFDLLHKERQILRLLHDFPEILQQAADTYSPALVANYVYELVKEYNGFYQDTPVLREEDENKIRFRLALSEFTARIVKSAMQLLGIEVPERM
ncbi:MAG: arginine--tRNA ligase [Bacteroidales bacterium]|nr:arginine--tRNA ligase [Bacteroidales bacterium]MCF8343391.1 arginine--tRNA ligase [Bacteroidales bacterium]MCF8351760.1 arginine--tRNA ligase [Bacteroidales bacterium]MCF8377562.1 arginine--tRNA ligase [Bacteroidales bacterium]MCF8401707.1 arginine--tRNA ligase [Bacteroidales bacterium]